MNSTGSSPALCIFVLFWDGLPQDVGTWTGLCPSVAYVGVMPLGRHTDFYERHSTVPLEES